MALFGTSWWGLLAQTMINPWAPVDRSQHHRSIHTYSLIIQGVRKNHDTTLTEGSHRGWSCDKCPLASLVGAMVVLILMTSYAPLF